MFFRASSIESVSYTHLRAHETLRYLVCRLLLEKTTAESTKDAVTGEGGEVNAEEARAAIIEARKQRKDSILNARKARRDSILEARKNNKKPIQEKIEGEGK